MFFTTYLTTNLINNNIYIGTHITKDPNDDYLGSGIVIDRAIEKYGSENFKKEVLFIFDNAEEMFSKERELVNEAFLERPDTYNVKLGGQGGWDFVNKTGLNIYENHRENAIKSFVLANQKLAELRLDENWCKIQGDKIREGLKNYYKDGGQNGFQDKLHSDETKKKIGSKNKGKIPWNKGKKYTKNKS